MADSFKLITVPLISFHQWLWPGDWEGRRYNWFAVTARFPVPKSSSTSAGHMGNSHDSSHTLKQKNVRFACLRDLPFSGKKHVFLRFLVGQPLRVLVAKYCLKTGTSWFTNISIGIIINTELYNISGGRNPIQHSDPLISKGSDGSHQHINVQMNTLD